MKTLAKKIFALRPEDFHPIRLHGIEMLLMRAAFAWLILHTLPQTIPWDRQPHPSGLAEFINLTFLHEPGMIGLLRLVLFVALGFYVLGKGMRGATLIVALIHIAIFSLKNSQGAIGHSSQIISLVLLAQTVAYWFPSFAQKTWEVWRKTGLTAHQLAVFAAQQTIVGVYLIAGWIKLIKTDGRWILDSPNIAVQMIKTHDQRFYNSLENNALFERGLEIANWIAANSVLARIVLGSGIILELIAFLALWNRRWGAIIGLGIITMHYGIEWVMNLHFRNNQLMVLIFLVNLPFWMFALFRRFWKCANPLWPETRNGSFRAGW